MTFEVIQSEERNETNPKLPKNKRLRRCLEICINLKDKKILLVAHGVFVFSLGIVLLVGQYAIKETTSSTVHTAPSMPTVVNSVMLILSGLLFTWLLVKKQRYLIIITIIMLTASGILSAIAAVHYGITVSNRLTSLSNCVYMSYQRLCTCSVVTSSLRVTYNFENTVSCTIITKHLHEVAYGMCGVYAVAFLSCFGAAVYVILLAHKVEIRKIQCGQQQEFATSIQSSSLKEKQPFEELTEDVSPVDTKKSASTWQHDVATQTASHNTGNDASCRHQCRHVVEVKVPDTSNDFVVNITKSRDPPPPYCETVYT